MDLTTTRDIGFIGTGAIGTAMAERLLRAGHRLRVFNRTRAAVAPLVALGAVAVETAREAFAGDVVCSALFDDQAIRALLLDDGVLAAAKPGLVHVCLSTISVAFARELAARHERHGVGYVAAPLLGRPAAVAQGAATLLVAGERSAVAAATPVLAQLGTVWPLGDVPAHANVAKLAANFLIGCSLEALAEASALAELNGLSSSSLFALVTERLFPTPIHRQYAAMMAARRPPADGAGLALPRKDVGLALAAASPAEDALPFAGVMQRILAAAPEESDFSIALAAAAWRRAGVG